MNDLARYKESYKKESAGAIYKSNYLVIYTDQKVNEAIRLIRQEGKDMRAIHYLYVGNEEERLTGVLSLRELITTEGDEIVANIMKSDVISVPTDMDQEEIAKVMQDFDFVALPVVNKAGKMIGIIHAEDIIDVMQAEATEDFHKMATITAPTVDVKKS